MPIVLIVDDSEADQVLIQEYMAEESFDWIVEFANSAEEAILCLQRLAVDVLVTDMRMPGMSGFELLHHVRSSHPHVPVVLITEHDNDRMAAEALDRGAASYIAKSELATRLVEVIKQMVQVAGLSRGFDILFQRVEEMEFRIRLENDPRLIPAFVSALDLIAERMQLCGRGESQRIGVALDEAILNAMYHGNLELPQDQLIDVRAELRNGNLRELITNRSQEAPYSERATLITASFKADRMQVTVRDDGSGCPADVRDAAASASGQDGHQGLVVIHHLMDNVSFNPAGNEITMTKFRCEPETTPEISLE